VNVAQQTSDLALQRLPATSGASHAADTTDRRLHATLDHVPVRVDLTQPYDDFPPVRFDLRVRGDRLALATATIAASAWARVPAGNYEIAVRPPYRMARPLAFDLAPPGGRFEATLAPWTARVHVVLHDAVGRPVEGVDLGTQTSDANGRVVFLAYAAQPRGTFRVEPTDPGLVLSPSEVSWNEPEVVLRVLQRFAVELDVSSPWPVEAYWLHCLTGGGEPGARPKKGWRELGAPLLLHPGATYAVALRGVDGALFGMCPLTGDERQQLATPKMCRIVVRSGQGARAAGDSIVAAIDRSGCLSIMDPITDVRHLPDGPPTAWLLSHEVEDATRPLIVPAGVRFIVSVRSGRQEERFGSFLVHEDGELQLPDHGHRIHRQAVVHVVVGDVETPLAVSLRAGVDAEGSAIRELRGDCALTVDISDGMRTIGYSALRRVDAATWVAFHSGTIALREGDSIEGVLDLRPLLPVTVRGMLEHAVMEDHHQDRECSLIFRPAGNTGTNVVTALMFDGRREPIDGPGVARVGADGQFSIVLADGDYHVDVVDAHGDDIGLARQSITCRNGAFLRVVTAPRVLNIGADNTRLYGVPEVLGPHGRCSVEPNGRRGAAVIGVQPGTYRVIWRDEARRIEREVIVEPGDVEKELADVKS
jgi:hypothetical protein